MKCGHIIKFGELGATAEDETPTRVCGRIATWVVSRPTEPTVRPRYRCDEHVQQYRDLLLDVAIEALP